MGAIVATHAKITFDDSRRDPWEGEAEYVYALPTQHPGFTQQIIGGAHTQAGAVPAQDIPDLRPVAGESA